MNEPVDIKQVIREAVDAGIQAGNIQAAREAQEAYKATERRLYAYPILCKKVEDGKGRLQDYMECGAPEKSKDVVRFMRSGMRLSADEVMDTLISDLEKSISINEYEIASIEAALVIVENDMYYPTVIGKYFEKKTDDEMANEIHCDPSTIRRNRNRLVRMVAIWLYGADAI